MFLLLPFLYFFQICLLAGFCYQSLTIDVSSVVGAPGRRGVLTTQGGIAGFFWATGKRACFNSPEWSRGPSPAKTEPPKIVLVVCCWLILLLLWCVVVVCRCRCGVSLWCVVVVVVVVVVSEVCLGVRCVRSQRHGNATAVTETNWWQVTWESRLPATPPPPLPALHSCDSSRAHPGRQRTSSKNCTWEKSTVFCAECSLRLLELVATCSQQ